ncbi:hemolysin family protein [Rhodothermus profundi]|uniref:Hemolysin, contains CBS domains n=1 Tax=Rhodothermus profundi TaxID=633813 RepID=A0A1M6XSK4_9BACT|nr:hemolysin family protein [Rhodothermus profundi]SHL08888.1 Hemolysin, contains CBS domains [Rhodothermus profundi]
MTVLLLTGAFVLAMLVAGAEAALVAANRLRLEVLARQGIRTARLAQALLAAPARPLTTTLAGLTLAQVLLALGLSRPLLSADNAFSPPGVVWGQVLLLVLGGGFAFYLGGLLVPAAVAREQANRLVQPGAALLRIASYLLWPLVRPAQAVSERLAHRLTIETDTVAAFMQRELSWQVQAAETETAPARDLDETESRLLANALAFEKLRVRDCMVPRTDIVAIEEQADLETLRQRFIESGYSRLPVYREHIDQIVGVVFAYDLFRQPQSLTQMIRPVRFVPESKPAHALLKEFLQTNTSIAIVIDEYGGTAGLVTQEDLLEELIGDIQDEFDVDRDEEYLLRRLDDRTWLVSGRVEIEELQEAGLKLPEGDYDTVAGYLLEKLGTIPAPQEEFELDGYRFTILKAAQNRITLIRITRL